MFGLFKKKDKKKSDFIPFKPVEYAAVKGNINSLYPDGHVDPAAKPSNDALKDLLQVVNDKKYPYIAIRGLKIESEDPVSKMKFAKIEVAIKEDQEGITSFIKLATDMKSKYYFTYIRLMGDTEENVGTRKVEVK